MFKFVKHRGYALLFVNLLMLSFISLVFTACGEPSCNGLKECLKGEWVVTPYGIGSVGYVIKFFDDGKTVGVKSGDSSYKIITTGEYSWVSDKSVKITFPGGGISAGGFGISISQIGAIFDASFQNDQLILTNFSLGGKTVYERYKELDVTPQNLEGLWYAGEPRESKCLGVLPVSYETVTFSIKPDNTFEIIHILNRQIYDQVQGIYAIQNNQFVIAGATSFNPNATPTPPPYTVDDGIHYYNNTGPIPPTPDDYQKLYDRLTRIEKPPVIDPGENIEGTVDAWRKLGITPTPRILTPTPNPTPTLEPTVTPTIPISIAVSKCHVSVSHYRLELSDDLGKQTVFIRNFQNSTTTATP